MPFIYNHDLGDLSTGRHLPDEETTRSTYYFNEDAEYKGAGILSGVGELLKSGVNLVKGNKDLIIEGVKAAGSTASAVNKVVDAIKEDKASKDLDLIRKLQNQNKEKKVSPSTKQKIADLAATKKDDPTPEQKGDGFVKF